MYFHILGNLEGTSTPRSFGDLAVVRFSRAIVTTWTGGMAALIAYVGIETPALRGCTSGSLKTV